MGTRTFVNDRLSFSPAKNMSRGMDMPLVDRRICRKAVQIASAFYIEYPDPLCAFDDHIKRMIIMRAVLFF